MSDFNPFSDDMTLVNLISIAHGIARQFGPDCEVCIHDLTTSDPEHSIIYIINGEVTGRKVGDGPSKIVLESIESLKHGMPLIDQLGYMTRTNGGKILKSSTIYVKDETGRHHYMLGINFDITNLVALDSAIRNITVSENPDAPKNADAIPTSVSELLDNLIEQSIQLVGKAPTLMTKDEKIKAIQFLNDAGAFLITKSSDKVASCFGISKFTLYSYIDVNKSKES